jgi:hypothetical protein
MRKNMKKITTIIVALIVMLAPVMASDRVICDDDRRVQYSELPAQAQAFIKQYFATERVQYVELDKGVVADEYKVVFESGKKVEFDGAGNWVEVDCHHDAVPAAIVPKQVASYVATHHRDHTIVELKRERHEWEAKLSNGRELTFDKRGKLVDVDD